MTLDEAIKHCENVAAKCFVERSARNHSGKCGFEHRQLAKWLRELKQLRQRTRWIPVSERLPELDEDGYSTYVLISFGLLTQTGIAQCRKSDNEIHWYEGDNAKAIESYGVHVNAWMPLPYPYIESEVE